MSGVDKYIWKKPAAIKFSKKKTKKAKYLFWKKNWFSKYRLMYTATIFTGSLVKP
jgi:hypothetical protein